jgi:hypothetical protein
LWFASSRRRRSERNTRTSTARTSDTTQGHVPVAHAVNQDRSWPLQLLQKSFILSVSKATSESREEEKTWEH